MLGEAMLQVACGSSNVELNLTELNCFSSRVGIKIFIFGL